MPRIRTIKPDFWEDEAVAGLSLRARLLFIATWNFADDEGLLRWTPEYVKSSAFMYDGLSTKTVRSTMDELEQAGFVKPYSAGRNTLAHLPNFLRHQRINRPMPTKFPRPSWLRDPVNDSLNDAHTTHPPLSEDAHTTHPLNGSGSGSGMEEESSSSPVSDEHLDERHPEEEEEGDAVTQEARRRLLLTTSDVVDPKAWVCKTAKRLRDEGWTPNVEEAKAPPPACPTCNDLALAEPCPDCGRSAA